MTNQDFTNAMKNFLQLCKSELQLKSLPKIYWLGNNELVNDRPTFGTYDTKDKSISINISNRHILDICRTLAHELVHYSQDLRNELTHKSGLTGSKHENEANSIAGVIMRKFNKKYPENFKLKVIDFDKKD